MSAVRRHTRRPDAGGWPGRLLLPTARRDWLFERASLTARLRRSGPVSVAVRRQGWARPHADERAVLGLGAGRHALVREVLLHVAGRPAVYAHTVANPAARRLLRRVGGRPLATVLFTDPRVRKGPLCFRVVDPRHPLHAGAQAAAGPLPRRLVARRALFVRGAVRLLVSEVFLPWRAA